MEATLRFSSILEQAEDTLSVERRRWNYIYIYIRREVRKGGREGGEGVREGRSERRIE